MKHMREMKSPTSVTLGFVDDGEIMGVRHKKFAIEGVQFHPEFKSTPWDGHPLFNAFVSAAHAYQSERKKLKVVA